MRWYIKVINNYSNFNGRARRKEYWMFFLFNVIFAFVAGIIDRILGTYPIIYIIYVIALLIPGLAVSVRRLHDTGRSGWWFFIALIPIIGTIWFFVLLVLDSDPEENSYGICPKKALDEEKQFVGGETEIY